MEITFRTYKLLLLERELDRLNLSEAEKRVNVTNSLEDVYVEAERYMLRDIRYTYHDQHFRL